MGGPFSTACSMPGAESANLKIMTPPPATTNSYSDYKKSHARKFSTAQDFPIQCATFFRNSASGRKIRDTVDVSYHEPTLNVNWTPLHDLQKTTMYLRRRKGPLEMIYIPSTSPAGGGHITFEKVPIPLAPNGKPVRVQVCVTANDDQPNESKPVGAQVGTRTL